MEVFREVREPVTGRLLFRYDPERELIEICERRQVVVVDLTAYRSGEALDNQNERAIISPY